MNEQEKIAEENRKSALIKERIAGFSSEQKQKALIMAHAAAAKELGLADNDPLKLSMLSFEHDEAPAGDFFNRPVMDCVKDSFGFCKP